MAKHRVCRLAAIALALVGCFLRSYPARAQSPTADSVIDTMSSAIDRWQKDIEFVCTYSISEAVASSRERARRGEYVEPPKQIATGVYAKMGPLIRLSLDYGRPAERSGNVASNVSTDQTRNEEVSVRYYPDHQSNPALDYIQIEEFQISELEGSAFIGKGMGTLSNPLVLFNDSNKPNLIAYFKSLRDAGEDVTIEHHAREDGNIDVHITHATSSGTNELKLMFSIAGEIPIATEATIQSHFPNGTTVAGGTVLEDFIAVTNGQMPRTCRFYFPMSPDSEQYRVTIWKSEDLGERRPKASDFAVRVRDGTRTVCFRPESVPKPIGGVQTFDVSRLSLSDINPECLHGVAPPTKQPSRSWLLRLIGACLAIAIVIGYGSHWYRQRRRQ